GKDTWPELLGAQGTDAEATIERENPLVDAVIVPEGSFVTADYRCDRVRVWVNTDGIVTRVPSIVDSNLSSSLQLVIVSAQSVKISRHGLEIGFLFWCLESSTVTTQADPPRIFPKTQDEPCGDPGITPMPG
ncbi:unnamed protein product, partial [Prunus brigantina]